MLTPEQVVATRRVLDEAEWVEASAITGHAPARARQNQQLPEHSAAARELGRQVLAALELSPLFVSAALPLRIFPPLFNRYSGGHSSGMHIDSAVRQVRGTGQPVRTDLSVTLFLAEPHEYDGGELVVEEIHGAHTVKLPAGHAVLYPATSLHRVQPVTRGARLASFFWIQSMVRDDAGRSLLFDLDTAIRLLKADTPDHGVAVRLTGVYHNLLRRWAQL